MNVPKLMTKWLRIPASNATRLIENVQTWEVRWVAYNHWGETCSNVEPQVEVFTSEEDAIAFDEALSQAIDLLRDKRRGNPNPRISKSAFAR